MSTYGGYFLSMLLLLLCQEGAIDVRLNRVQTADCGGVSQMGRCWDGDS